jgi:hypothetical protein
MRANAVSIVCIVEGHGEVEAVPILLRRLAERLAPGIMVFVPRAIRVTKSQLLREGELERAVELAARMDESVTGVLIMLDSDDDCPAELGPKLLKRATEARSDMQLAVVLAKREFESWFLAAAESLAGYRGLSAQLHAPADPEAIRGAKEWLSDHMQPGRSYGPTLDQPRYAAHMDLDKALTSPSFQKLWREVKRLLAAAMPAGSTGADAPAADLPAP